MKNLLHNLKNAHTSSREKKCRTASCKKHTQSKGSRHKLNKRLHSKNKKNKNITFFSVTQKHLNIRQEVVNSKTRENFFYLTQPFFLLTCECKGAGALSVKSLYQLCFLVSPQSWVTLFFAEIEEQYLCGSENLKFIVLVENH